MLSAMPVMAHACGEVCSRNEPGLNWVPESVKRMYSANVMASTDWGSAPRWWGSTYEQVGYKAIRVRVGHPSNGRGREQFAQRFDQPIATLCSIALSTGRRTGSRCGSRIATEIIRRQNCSDQTKSIYCRPSPRDGGG